MFHTNFYCIFSFSPPSFQSIILKALVRISALALLKRLVRQLEQATVSNSVHQLVGALRFHLNWFAHNSSSRMRLSCFQDWITLKLPCMRTLESSTLTQFPIETIVTIGFLINLSAYPSLTLQSQKSSRFRWFLPLSILLEVKHFTDFRKSA